jgi:RND family efflux transporter MFP subunit
MKKTRYVLPFAIAILGLASLTACSSEKNTAAATPEVVRNVQLLTVGESKVPDTLEAMGTVQAAQTAQVSSQMMGNIVAVNVHEGDRVHRGQLLTTIDASQPQTALERAQAALNAAKQEAAATESDLTLAQSTQKRYQMLFDKKSVSPQEMDEVKARYQGASARREMAIAGQAQAQAALAQARTALGYTKIVSPFDGVVTERKVDPGALAAPGMPLLTIQASGRYRLDASVDESGLRYLRIGQEVPVVVNSASDTPFEGKVVQIVPAADPASRSFIVKIELPPNPALHSGMFGRARFSKGARESIVVPKDAVVTRGQLQAVYVVGNNDIAQMRYVTLGSTDGSGQEVLSGLNQGERLVAAPGDRDLSGKRIEVQ